MRVRFLKFSGQLVKSVSFWLRDPISKMKVANDSRRHCINLWPLQCAHTNGVTEQPSHSTSLNTHFTVQVNRVESFIMAVRAYPRVTEVDILEIRTLSKISSTSSSVTWRRKPRHNTSPVETVRHGSQRSWGGCLCHQLCRASALLRAGSKATTGH